MASLLPDICAKVGTITIKPSETDLVKLAEKGNYSPAPFLDKTMGRLGKIFEKLKFAANLRIYNQNMIRNVATAIWHTHNENRKIITLIEKFVNKDAIRYVDVKV